MNPGDKNTPSNILRRINTIGNRRPTQEEWDALVDSTHVAMTRTICKYAKRGKRPPELDFFDGEKEDVLSEASPSWVIEAARAIKNQRARDHLDSVCYLLQNADIVRPVANCTK